MCAFAVLPFAISAFWLTVVVVRLRSLIARQRALIAAGY
jgi:hypothetical protein